MIILGLVLLLIGWFVGISILTTIGVILMIIGALLYVVPLGGQRRGRW